MYTQDHRYGAVFTFNGTARQKGFYRVQGPWGTAYGYCIVGRLGLLYICFWVDLGHRQRLCVYRGFMNYGT